MNIQQASLIAELLSNAGWLDDGDELFLDHLDGLGIELTKQKAKTIDSLIKQINVLVPDDEKISEKVSFVDLLDDIIEEQVSCGTILKP